MSVIRNTRPRCRICRSGIWLEARSKRGSSPRCWNAQRSSSRMSGFSKITRPPTNKRHTTRTSSSTGRRRTKRNKLRCIRSWMLFANRTRKLCLLPVPEATRRRSEARASKRRWTANLTVILRIVIDIVFSHPRSLKFILWINFQLKDQGFSLYFSFSHFGLDTIPIFSFLDSLFSIILRSRRQKNNIVGEFFR